MPRYFIEVAYKGTNYSGFQVQENADTIQGEIEKALSILYQAAFALTGASRTDSGVHAIQNFFHFDSEINFLPAHIYNLNAILPADIVIRNLYPVTDTAHCRFDATRRMYEYFIYQKKDPFIKDVAYFYPYPLDLDLLNQAATVLKSYQDFTSFSKRNTQVNNYNCKLFESVWIYNNDNFIYRVSGNRFLRGMVRGLVGTMLRVGSGKISLEGFVKIIELKDCSKADFSVPGHGLFLKSVVYPV